MQARIHAQPVPAPEQVAPQSGLTLQLQVPAKDGKTLQHEFPMPLLIQQNPGQPPLIRCDPALLYPTTTAELTQLIAAALPDHPGPESLAQEVMEHHSCPVPDTAAHLTTEQTERLTRLLTDAAAWNIPGERDDYSVFRIDYQDGCSYTGHTSQGITTRLDQLHGIDQTIFSQPFHQTARHAEAMEYTVTCLNSGLRMQDATTLCRLLTGTKAAMSVTRDCPIGGKEAQIRDNPVRQWQERRRQASM